MPAFQRVSVSRHVTVGWELIGLKLRQARSSFMTIVRLFTPLRRVLFDTSTVVTFDQEVQYFLCQKLRTRH